jgi:hypothetical protein
LDGKTSGHLYVPFRPEYALDRSFPRLLIDEASAPPGIARIGQHGRARLCPAFLAPNAGQDIAQQALFISADDF